MLTVLTANGPSGYSIANSLRFRSSASAYLNRTPSVAGNQKTFTWSGWVKRGILSQGGPLFVCGTGPSAATGWFAFSYGYGNAYSLEMNCGVQGVSSEFWCQTLGVFRDPSAWYHIVLAFDSTQATASNRVKIYVNSVLQTLTNYGGYSTYPSQNYSTAYSAAVPHYISRDPISLLDYFDGYLTEVNFIDGQALTPSSFGEIDSTTGVWKAKRYTGTYGTNGFKLNFSNGTSTTTLGYDSSGNGNNWTTNNISLTAGSTYDWMIDSPTPYQGTSYGVGNYAVMNPLSSPGISAPINGNLTISSTGPEAGYWLSSISVASATYFEVQLVSGSGSTQIGLDGGAFTYNSWDGNLYVNSVNVANTPTSANDIFGVAIFGSGAAFQFIKNGAVVYSGTTPLSYGRFYVGDIGSNAITVNANFGQRPFAYTPPSGYKSLCTQNLPGVTIQNGAAYMAATTYTGDGANTRSIINAYNSVSFQPDFVWIKDRTSAYSNALFNSIVGGGANTGLASNTTDSEASFNDNAGFGYLSSFDTSGFSVVRGTNGTISYTNSSAGDNYVAWQWKAGGTAVTNTAGSITSSVSANPTAGFSVVTWTCNNTANQSIGHGLGVAPSLVIVKDRDQGSSFNWNVWFTGFTANEYLQLNTTIAKASYSTLWYTVPDSTKIYIGTAGTAVNNATDKMVAYCFAAIPGYSAFGSYTGNGSADGPFVYCGFRPRFILVKRSSTSGTNWNIYDTARNPINVAGNMLFADLSDAELTNEVSLYYDILSNGFKIRTTGSSVNLSGGTFIYAAFAENPFQNALAR